MLETPPGRQSAGSPRGPARLTVPAQGPDLIASGEALGARSYRPRLSLAFNHGFEATTRIHRNEITVAELLRLPGYATRMVCKGNLGGAPNCLPHLHGSDSWFGIPISNARNRRGQLEASESRGLLVDAEDEFDTRGRHPVLVEELLEREREFVAELESGVRLGRQLIPAAESPSPTGWPA